MPHALIVDDDVDFQQGLAEVVRQDGFTAATATSLQAARDAIAKQPPDVLFVDLNLPDGHGLDLLETLEVTPPTVLITGQATVDTAVEALRRGVADYLTKPVDLARVKVVLANVSRTLEMNEEIGTLRGELRRLGHFGPIIGASPAMQRVYDLLGRVARTDATTLITGETGSGKELVAQTIHQMSRRRRDPFLAVNCGAVSANLIESEMFGHERGSFTGADRVHKGFFERANRGTLFLDEITEMPIELQVRLLRVLETSEVVRVGGAEAIKVNVRVIAATNLVPEQAVASGKLREDLFFRLNVFPIHLPPLSERREDVEILADHFLAQLNKQEGTNRQFSDAARERMKAHRWPGNVRELRNVIQRAFIMSEDEIGVEVLPLGTTTVESPATDLHLRVGTSIPEAERRLIMATLESFGGDKKKAATVLKISLKTLYSRLTQYRGSD